MKSSVYLFIFALLLTPEAWGQRKLLIQANSLADDGPSRSVTVLGPEEILAAGDRPLVDVLDSVPSLEVQREGGRGQIARVLIRGARASDTLVLLDGIEINDVLDPRGAFDFSTLNSGDVERIEVYRGPQGVRFGSGAIGGVINIVTRKGQGRLRPTYRLEAGSYDSFSSSLGVLGARESVSYALSLSHLETGGFSAASEDRGNPEKDGSRLGQIQAKVGLDLTESLSAQVTARISELAMDVDYAGGPGGDDPNYTSTSRGLQAGLSFQHLSSSTSSSLGYYRSELKRETQNLPDADRADFHQDSFGSSLDKVRGEHSWAFLEDHVLILGLEHRSETGNSYGNYSGFVTEIDQVRQSVFSSSATYLFESTSWFGDAGVRRDFYRSMATPSYRLSAGRKFAEIFKSTLTWGTGFKVPSLYQLYSDFGNSSLGPEKAQSFSFAVEAEGNHGSAAITYFDTTYRDLIEFDNTQYFNTHKASIKGAELSVGWRLIPGHLVKASYSYVDSKDELTSAPLLRYPRNSWTLSYNAQMERWQLGAHLRGKGDRPDSYFDPVSFAQTSVVNPAYETADLTAGYDLGGGLRAHIRIQNVTDRGYEEVWGYGTPGRSFYVGLSGGLEP